MELKEKVAIITGSSQGIGLEIAKVFLQEGAKVVLNGRSMEKLEKSLSDLEECFDTSIKERCLLVGGDVSQSDTAQQLVSDTIKHFEKIDVLINNAGITRDNLIMRMKEEEWDDVLSTNLKSQFLLSKAAVRSMLKAQSGSIINISSVIGQMGNAGQANYSAAKGGILAFTKSLAREVGSRNITVNAIAPGYIKTEMTQLLSEEIKQNLLSHIPLNRLGTTNEIANCSVFLASDKARYITGQIIAVNGGLYM